MKSIAVIPAYNEGKTIRKVIEKTVQFVDRVIVVDDGSRDNTVEEVRKTSAELIVLPKNKGKANAIKTGFKECRNYDIVVMLDGDLQHPPEEIPALVKCIEEGNDLCIGSRFFKGPGIMPLSCRFSNRVASLLISFLARQKITDPQSGFRAIRRERLDELELNAKRYAIEHIMVLEAARKNFKIKETPMSCVYGKEKSHIKPVRDTLRVMYHILRFVLGRISKG
jgi:glycosyltransferase involved in cell wall biosynthesis